MKVAEHTEKEKVHIIVVEDSLTQAARLEHLLSGHGYDVSIAKDGKEALELLKNEKPDLIISDIIMPVMDGYELCRIIKDDITLSTIPVILLTSLSNPEEVVNGLKCGADNFITKPYKDKFILSRVEHVLANREFLQSADSEQGIEVYFAGDRHYIKSDRVQAINLLLSTYENAIEKNCELDEVNKELFALRDTLQKTNAELLQLNLELDHRVTERTVEIERKSEEIKIISQQLLQVEKLATMGELAASIAHELNNPLAIVSLRLESLTAQISGDAPYLRELEIIGQEVERMGKLVANLLLFSRRGQPQTSTVDICEEIENTLELVHYHLRKYNVKIIREFAPDVPKIHADRQQLRQLFLNLFTNASDAMPEGGTLTIRTYTQGSEGRDQETGVRGQGSEVRDQGSENRIEKSQISNLKSEIVSPDPKGRAFVVIEIADTGMGIPPEILLRMMETFFTTKPEGKGTGLGLAICRRVVRGHKGTFEIKSSCEIPRGTTVRVVFPSSLNSATSGSLREEKLDE
ncbi:MAG: response regulator [Syntrophorhabdaceae bacterium]|nr:response regulator [Syntrophorhabdaceae bacterium]MDD5242748.1 response regulator [Syntrophorhabdaceae bacterium]